MPDRPKFPDTRELERHLTFEVFPPASPLLIPTLQVALVYLRQGLPSVRVPVEDRLARLYCQDRTRPRADWLASHFGLGKYVDAPANTAPVEPTRDDRYAAAAAL